MNTILDKYKWIKYVVGSLIIALGVLIIVFAFSNLGALENVMTVIIAVALIVLGLFSLVITLFSETHKGFSMSLLISSGIIAAGIVLLVSRFHLQIGFDKRLLVFIIAVFTLVFGVASLFKAVTLIVYKEKKPLIALMILVAVVAITLGILGIVFAEKLGGLVIAAFVILGILVLVTGILMVVFAAISDKKKSDSK